MVTIKIPTATIQLTSCMYISYLMTDLSSQYYWVLFRLQSQIYAYMLVRIMEACH